MSEEQYQEELSRMEEEMSEPEDDDNDPDVPAE